MHLNRLSLINYKNIPELSIDLDTKINAIVGRNGIGKTTLLDAIYHLAIGKSYFNPIASQNIKHQQDFFVIEGDFISNDKSENIVCSLKKGLKKIIKRNGKIYDKLSDHVGLISVVMISPCDADLISEGSEIRRKFIDSIISLYNINYLHQLINYQKTLEQRNALLKYFAANQVFDEINLSIYNNQLIEFGNYIYQQRMEFIDLFSPIFKKYYQIISENTEEVAINYMSHLNEKDFETGLKETLLKDRLVQHSTFGTHKDDLEFQLNGFPIKKYGSQGQQKSYLIALKLAQFELIKNQNNSLPILLFDDIFDKLDAYRVKQIISMINEDIFGQIFISDTHEERTENIIKQTHKSYKIIHL